MAIKTTIINNNNTSSKKTVLVQNNNGWTPQIVNKKEISAEAQNTSVATSYTYTTMNLVDTVENINTTQNQNSELTENTSINPTLNDIISDENNKSSNLGTKINDNNDLTLDKVGKEQIFVNDADDLNLDVIIPATTYNFEISKKPSLLNQSVPTPTPNTAALELHYNIDNNNGSLTAYCITENLQESIFKLIKIQYIDKTDDTNIADYTYTYANGKLLNSEDKTSTPTQQLINYITAEYCNLGCTTVKNSSGVGSSIYKGYYNFNINKSLMEELSNKITITYVYEVYGFNNKVYKEYPNPRQYINVILTGKQELVAERHPLYIITDKVQNDINIDYQTNIPNSNKYILSLNLSILDYDNNIDKTRIQFNLDDNTNNIVNEELKTQILKLGDPIYTLLGVETNLIGKVQLTVANIQISVPIILNEEYEFNDRKTVVLEITEANTEANVIFQTVNINCTYTKNVKKTIEILPSNFIINGSGVSFADLIDTTIWQYSSIKVNNDGIEENIDAITVETNHKRLQNESDGYFLYTKNYDYFEPITYNNILEYTIKDKEIQNEFILPIDIIYYNSQNILDIKAQLDILGPYLISRGAFIKFTIINAEIDTTTTYFNYYKNNPNEAIPLIHLSYFVFNINARKFTIEPCNIINKKTMNLNNRVWNNTQAGYDTLLKCTQFKVESYIHNYGQKIGIPHEIEVSSCYEYEMENGEFCENSACPTSASIFYVNQKQNDDNQYYIEASYYLVPHLPHYYFNRVHRVQIKTLNMVEGKPQNNEITRYMYFYEPAATYHISLLYDNNYTLDNAVPITITDTTPITFYEFAENYKPTKHQSFIITDNKGNTYTLNNYETFVLTYKNTEVVNNNFSIIKAKDVKTETSNNLKNITPYITINPEINNMDININTHEASSDIQTYKLNWNKTLINIGDSDSSTGKVEAEEIGISAINYDYQGKYRVHINIALPSSLITQLIKTNWCLRVTFSQNTINNKCTDIMLPFALAQKIKSSTPIYYNTIKGLWYGSEDLAAPVIDYSNNNESVSFSQKMEALYNKSEIVYVVSKTTLINMYEGHDANIAIHLNIFDADKLSK